MFARYGDESKAQKQRIEQDQTERREEREAYERALIAKDQDIEKLEKEHIDTALSNTAFQIKGSKRPYALILIDGDGYIFHEYYIRLGVRGGELAAEIFREQINQHFHEHKIVNGGTWDLKVRIFLNLEGLGNTMRDVGYVPNLDSLALFFRGFTGTSLFDVMDASHYKEAADTKLKAHFDSDINDLGLRCKHLFLGCSHDGGYVALVRQCKDNLEYESPPSP